MAIKLLLHTIAFYMKGFTLSRNSFLWHGVPEWRNKLAHGDFLWQSRERSKIICSYRCLQHKSCVSFFYQSSTQYCQGHSSVFLHLSDASSKDSSETVYFKIACKGGPSYIYDRGANTCYSVKEKRGSWFTAQSYCNSENSWLLDLSDDQISSQLMTKFNDHRDPYFAYFWFWIGLTIQSDGRFIWRHSQQPLNGSVYWLPGQPDNATGNQNCVYMRNHGGKFLWDDIDCMTDFIEFICQSDVV
ncbi:C-type lectin-like [Saccostrea echinata]|uniref:C-type lectin-like n=1 Tax=Saccostrea echinata TaxID=191078 RepID=UPI002A7F711F|nr:C-type lectin-like [Saccostrea echinata]